MLDDCKVNSIIDIANEIVNSNEIDNDYCEHLKNNLKDKLYNYSLCNRNSDILGRMYELKYILFYVNTYLKNQAELL